MNRAGGALRLGGDATFAVWDAAQVGEEGLPELLEGATGPTCRSTVRAGVELYSR